VLTDPEKWPHFRYHIKQRGALLAKGRLLGVQFAALMEDDRYRRRGERANAQAQRLKGAFLKKGCSMLCDTVTNQIFPVCPTTLWRPWANGSRSRTGRRWTARIPPCASAREHTPPPKTWRR
jgi:threonine aldolase